jgi:hypothetical protein
MVQMGDAGVAVRCSGPDRNLDEIEMEVISISPQMENNWLQLEKKWEKLLAESGAKLRAFRRVLGGYPSYTLSIRMDAARAKP